MNNNRSDRSKVPVSTQNSAASARRRLLQAIGGGFGAATLHRLAISGWTRPVVDIAVLPAHARSSTIVNCPITICGMASQTGGENFTLALGIQHVSALTQVITSGSTSLCVTAALPTGATQFFEAAIDVVSSYTVSMSASCCFTTGSDSQTGPGGGGGVGVFVTAGDDGQCTILPPDSD